MPSEKRERQRQNREAARTRRQRDERRARLRSNVLRFGGVAVLVIVAGLLFFRSDPDEPVATTAPPVAATTQPAATEPADTSAATTQPTETAAPPAEGEVATAEYLSFRSLPVACGGELPPAAQDLSFDSPQDQGLSGEVRATLQTSCGDLVLLLDADAAPEAVNSFAFLASEGYFNGTVSHRIVPGFVYQAGDPTATGRGGPGYRFEDELPAADFTYVRGTVAMANSGPNTNGSQFFIVFQDAALGPDFTVFGSVESGLDVLDRIEAVPVAGQQPLESVYIEGVLIEN